MDQTFDFDAITADQLRLLGGSKWSAGPDVIGAFVAEMDFGTAPTVVQAIHAATDRGLLGYLPSGLATTLGHATARWCADAYGWTVRPEHVHPVADVITTLEITIEHFSRPGSAVIVPTPTYMKFLTVPPALGRRVIEVPMLQSSGRAELDLEGLDKAFREGGDLLLLCNPFNPLGRVFTPDELVAVSEVVSRHGGRVYADEVHAPIVYPGARHTAYASVSETAAAHTVTGTSAAKAWNLAGMKCAQVIFSNDADAARWPQISPMVGHGASNLGVIANTAAFSTGRAWLDQVVGYNDRNRKLLAELVAEHLPGVRYTPPEGTFVAWLDCRGAGLGDRPAAFFREHAAVALTEGVTCGADAAGFVRLAFATPRPILEEMLLRMGKALARFGGGRG